MDSVKILHTADLHIDSPLLSLGEKGAVRNSELLESFGRIVDTAKRESVDFLFIAGDLFDTSYPSPSSVSYVKRKLSEIPEIRVFIALGNHDFGFLATDFPENTHIFKTCPEKIETEKANIYGISFSGEYCDECLAEKFTADDDSKINILILHGDLVSKGSSSRYNPVSPIVLERTGMDYIALGHIHKADEVPKLYAYCGTPEGRGFDEDGEKGFILGDVFKKGHHLKFVPSCKRKFVRLDVDVSSFPDEQEILNAIREKHPLKDDLLKVTLTGSVSAVFFDTENLKKILSEEYFYIKFKDKTVPSADFELISREHTLKGLFFKKLLEANADEFTLKAALSAIENRKVDVSN